MRTPARAPRWRLTELRLMGALTAMSLLALTAGLVLERVASTTAAPLVIYVLAYAAGGAFPARSALAALRARRLDVNLLMVTAAIGAAALGHWDEGAALMFLFSLSGTLETYALARTRRAVEALMDLRPETARIDRDGREAEVPIEALVPGDLVIVRPGDRLPVDGDVVQGASAVDESTVTGEATPVDKQPGDRVFATTLNRNGVLRVRATARASESTLARIVRLVEEAEDARPRAQRLADRVGPYYTMAVFGGALLVLLATRYVFQFPWNDAVYRAMMVLVVASPCAVMIPIPAAVLSAIANAALRGIVFKGGDRLEAAARIRVVAFDKTGTITRARAALSGLITLNGASEAHTLQIAAAVEQHSEHPLAVAVVEAAAARGLAPLASSDFIATAGHGVAALVEGRRVTVEKLDAARTPMTAVERAAVERLRAAGQSTLVVSSDADGPLGVLAVTDEVRPEARGVMHALRAMGVRTVMLTGDHAAVAEAVAAAVGVDEVHADLRPEQKAHAIRELEARHGPVAMVGDGINDAPALASAHLGIAMGMGGTDVALETGDVVLTSDEIERIPMALELARRTVVVIRQNLVWAFAVILGLLVAALGGWLSLTVAVMGHEGSTLIGVLNGLRLLRRVRPGRAAPAPVQLAPAAPA